MMGRPVIENLTENFLNHINLLYGGTFDVFVEARNY